ncbi:alkaline phosphatase family protein [Paenibacillus filicis]|uniref:Alkaline phosphatase family protein n=1 Tax=Paenibacillus gyeongsangnamensis TaxID=3388067 RepID=A0ABT4Q3V8_9BACL|nr:alkaline phosphatase family protein [Paenibacillus filicis]MCZ8511532.1 alkaline phosphatase family protein [Paenibacillus filicis]
MVFQAESHAANRRILIIGTDGLRPDSFDPELMPTYAELMKRGTLFTSFHAAYPSETRVSMTTLTTGVYPGRHGVVGNLKYVPGFGEDGLVQTGNDKHLLSYSRMKSEPFILCPTLGDRLHEHGKCLAVAASSSPGASLLWNLNHPELVVNPSSWYGVSKLEQLHNQLGNVPEERSRVKKERALWAARALTDIHLKNPDNQVMVLWLSEPDASQHDYGLGSPENKEALRLIDHCLSEVLKAVEREGLSEQLDIFLISDHGHSTVRAQGSLQGHIQRACDELGLQSKFVTTGHYVYAAAEQELSNQDVAALISWLQAQEWCELVFAGPSEFVDLRGVLPLELLLGPISHNRAPLIAIQPKWNDAANEYGIPGTTQTLTSSSVLLSTHGTVSPYDIQAFCMGVGSSFKQGYVSNIPCGIVDIAPTVCHLIGLRSESGFDGRILAEALQPELIKGLQQEPEVKKTKVESGLKSAKGLNVLTVNRTNYVVGC